MSRFLPHRHLRDFSGDSTGEAVAFAEALLGKPLPGNRVPRDQGAPADRQLLEWLATFSTEHERQLRAVLFEEAAAAEVSESRRRSTDWPDSIAEEWDESKHPRDGGPPNPGWFASTGGSAASSKPAAQNQPREQDVLAQAPQPGQPPAQGGQQLPAPGNDGYPHPFGTWPKRLAGAATVPVRDNGMEWPQKPQAKGAHDALPKPVQSMLNSKGVEVSLDRDDSAVRTRNPDMKPEALGAYDSSTGTIHIFGGRRIAGGAVPPNLEVAHTLHHEVGHAADHYLQNMSQTPEFMQAYQADVNAVPNHAALSNADRHALSKSKEAFAESFARTLEGRKNPGVLPNSMKYMQRSGAVQQLLGP